MKTKTATLSFLVLATMMALSLASIPSTAQPDDPEDLPDLTCVVNGGVFELVKIKDPDGAVFFEFEAGECGVYLAVYHQYSLQPDHEDYWTYYRHWIDVAPPIVCCPPL